MAEEPATTTYSIPEPFEEAVRSLRHVLSQAGLKITGELDMAGRLQRRLLVDTPPCLVLFASPSMPLLRGPYADPGVAALTPLHIVISARGSYTEIHVLRIPAKDGQRDTEEMAALGRFQVELSQAIEKVGMRSVLRV